MMEEVNDGLQILVEAALDFAKSLTTMSAQMRQLQEKFKDYQIKITAGLNQTASARQIKSDLAQIAKTKGRVKIVGEMDKTATKKNVDTAMKKLKNAEVKLTGVLDSAATQENVRRQLAQIPEIRTTADVDIDGGDEVDKLRSQMDNAGKSAESMAGKLYIARSALQLLRRAATEAKDTVLELDKAATGLAIVSGSRSEEAYSLLEEYNQMAQQLGSTTAQISNAATCRTANCSGGKQQNKKREKRHGRRGQARAAEKAARKGKLNDLHKKGSRNL